MKNYRKKNKSKLKVKGQRLKTFYYLAFIFTFCCLYSELSGGDYEITRFQTGGVGSGFYKQDGIVQTGGKRSISYNKDSVELYHSFSQSPPVGISENNNMELFSGYLIIGGYPLQIVSMNPSNCELGVSVSATAKVYFDGEVNPETIGSAVSMLGIRNEAGTIIAEAIPVSTKYVSEDSSIEIASVQMLQNNYRYQIVISTALTEVIGDLPLSLAMQSRFTTIFSPQYDNVMISDYNEKLKIEIPKLALSKNYCINISTSPLSSPIKTAPERIRIANSKAISDAPDREILAYYEMVPFDSEKKSIDVKPEKNLYVSLPYSAKQPQETIRRQSQSAAERLSKNINLYRLNEEKKLWVRIPGVSLDYENQLLKGTIPYFGTFALVVDPNYYLGDAYAYPVPFSPNENPNHKTITFTNLATRCTIKIFTVSGELVNEFEETDGDGEYVWTDVKNKKGESLASGVYLYLIESKQDHKVGKLMIIK